MEIGGHQAFAMQPSPGNEPFLVHAGHILLAGPCLLSWVQRQERESDSAPGAFTVLAKY